MVKNLNMVNNWYVVKINVDEHFRPTDFKGPSKGGGGAAGCIVRKRHAEGFKILLKFFFMPRNLNSHARHEKIYAVIPRS